MYHDRVIRKAKQLNISPNLVYESAIEALDIVERKLEKEELDNLPVGELNIDNEPTFTIEEMFELFEGCLKK